MNRKSLILICVVLLMAAALPIHAQKAEDCLNETFTDYNDTVEACDAWLELNPTSSDGYFARAYAYSELGNYEAAIVDYTKVLIMSPKYALAFNNRGFAYSLLGDHEAAIRDYTRALLTDNNYTQALINRAYTYIELGDYENALADADLLQTMEADDTYVYLLMGTIYLDQELYDEAIETYNDYIDLAPQDPSGYLSRGFAYWMMGEDALAAVDYLEWIERNAPDAEAIDPDDALEPFTLTFEDGSIYYTLEIEAEAGDILTASAVAEQITFDPALVLLDPDGNPITVDDDTAGGIGEVDAIIDGFELPEDGVYTLIIGYAGGGSVGDVEVDVRLNSEA